MKRLFCSVVMLFCLTGVSYGHEESVKVAWDANTEDDLAGYRVFKRFAPDPYDYLVPIWEGSETETTTIPTNTWQDGDYHFVARAFDTDGHESGDSNEVTLPVDHTPPAPPGGCKVLRIPSG